MGRFAGRLPRAVLLELDQIPESCQKRVKDTQSLLRDSVKALVQQGVANKAFKHPKPKLVMDTLLASADSITMQTASAGASTYETLFAYLPGIFVPALKAGK